jgi:hypothetical protein
MKDGWKPVSADGHGDDGNDKQSAMSSITQNEAQPFELRHGHKDEEEDEAEERGRQEKEAHEKSLGGPDAIDPQLASSAVPNRFVFHPAVVVLRLVPAQICISLD